MPRLKLLFGFVLVMLGGGMLLAVFLAPYADGVVAEFIPEPDFNMFFLGLASVYFGAAIMGSALTQIDIEQKSLTKREYLGTLTQTIGNGE